jgi:hypothetical protein
MTMPSTHTGTETIVNLTGEQVRILDRSGHLITTLLSNGKVEAIGGSSEELPSIGNIPFQGVQYSSYNLPKEEPGVWLLVPEQIMRFYFRRKDLVSLGEPIRASQGYVLGYFGLICNALKTDSREQDFETLFDFVNEESRPDHGNPHLPPAVFEAIGRITRWFNSAK